MKQLWMGLIACALILTSCAKTEIGDSLDLNNSKLKFSMVLGQQSTKAGETMLETVQSDAGGIDLWAYYNSGTVTSSLQNTQYFKDVLTYSTTTTPPWNTVYTRFIPVNETLDFYAVHPKGSTITRAADGTTTTMEYTVVANPANQKDLIVASKVGVGTGSEIMLNMRHLLSQVNFGVYGYKGAQIEIKNLRVNSVNEKGTYTFDNDKPGTWAVDGSTTMSYNYPQVGSISPANAVTGDKYIFGDGGNWAVGTTAWYYVGDDWYNGYTPDVPNSPKNSLMLMPQSFDGSTATVTFDYKITDGEGKPIAQAAGASFDLDNAPALVNEWKLNYRYVYMINFQPLLDGRKVTFDVNVIEWDNWNKDTDDNGVVEPELDLDITTIHILPNDPNLVNGVYTIPVGLIPAGATKIALIFDDKSVAGSHDTELEIVIPSGLNIDINIDLDLIENNNTNLKIHSAEYTGTIEMVDHYVTGTPTQLNNLDINLPLGSFKVAGNYQFQSNVVVTTAPSSFILNNGTGMIDIMGNLTINGGKAIIDGSVGGNVIVNKGEVYLNGGVTGNVNANGGSKVTLSCDAKKLFVKDAGTEVYVTKVGYWFKTADINTFNTSNGFQGFNPLSLLSNADLSGLFDLIGAVGGADLGAIGDILGGGIDLSIINTLISTDFYWCGATTKFTNEYVRKAGNFNRLTSVDYFLLSGNNKYKAFLPKNGVTGMPLLEQIQGGGSIYGSLMGLGGLNQYDVPTLYAATNNFSMKGIIDLLDMYYTIANLVKGLEDLGAIETIQSYYDGTIWSNKYGITNPEVLNTIPRRENYASGTLGTLAYNAACSVWALGAGVPVNRILDIIGDLAFKSVIDIAIESMGGDLDPAMLQTVLASLTQIAGLLDTVTPIIDAIYQPLAQVNDFILSVQALNPWGFDAGGAAFTSVTPITGLDAIFTIDAAGLPVEIKNGYTK